MDMSSPGRVHPKRPVSERFSAALALLTGALGVAVLAGWHAGSAAVVQLRPGFVPMAYNTALCFVLSGAGLLLACRGRARLGSAAGAAVAVSGILALAQYASGADLGIDHILFRQTIVVSGALPGRMAPNTALCFLLAGIALLLEGIPGGGRRRSMGIGLLGAAVCSLGVVALLGYLAGIPDAYGWGRITRMAVHTAAGLVFLGAGIVAHAWRKDRAEGEGAPSWLPALAAVGVATMAVVLWQALGTAERRQIERTVYTASEASRDDLAARMESRILALAHIAKDRGVPGEGTREAWQSDAEFYVGHYAGALGVGWVDESLRIRWHWPDQSAVGLYLGLEERRRGAFESSRNRGQPSVSRPITLMDGSAGFLIVVPVAPGDPSRGFVQGVFRAQELFEALLGTVGRGYAVSVFSGADRLYANAAAAEDKLPWARETSLDLFDATWRVRVSPTPALLGKMHSALDEMVLVAGLAVAALLALALRFAQLAALRAREAQDSSRRLEAEVEDRMWAEEALRQSEQQLRDFFEENPSAVSESTPGGDISFCNSSFLRMFGFASMEEALRTPVSTLYRTPEGRDSILATLCKQGKVEHQEMPLIRRDGTPLDVVANIVGRFDSHGNLAGIKWYLLDVTEHRKLEERLLQSQKLECVGTLVAGIAHDFNNILMGVMGRAELALMNLPGGSPARPDVELIIQFARRAASLISQLMAFSRREVAQKQRFALGPVFKETAKILQRTLPETIAMRLSVPGDLWAIEGDVTQIQQVLMNLCINARDAMPEGGELNVGVTNVVLDRPESSPIPWAEAGEYVCLTVKDTARGMPPEVRERIFEPFFTTKRPGSGTGLGLATVYGIVQSHGGTIDVSSEVGRGAEFRVYLPAVREAASDEAQAAVPVPGGSETVLVVEDEDEVREVAALLLQRLGYDVVTAADGEQAMGILQERGAEVSAILSDTVMPKMGGVALVEALAGMEGAPPVLLMSGYASERDREAMEALGVSAFVQKPLSLRDLAGRLRAALDA